MTDLSVESICARLKKVPVEEWKEASVSGRHAYHADVSGMNFRVSYNTKEHRSYADGEQGTVSILEEAQLEVIDPESKLVVFTQQDSSWQGDSRKSSLLTLYLDIKKNIYQHQQKTEEQRKERLLAAGRARLEAIVKE